LAELIWAAVVARAGGAGHRADRRRVGVARVDGAGLVMQDGGPVGGGADLVHLDPGDGGGGC